MDNKKERLYINKMFELKCEGGKYKMILCNALMSGDLEIDIDYKDKVLVVSSVSRSLQHRRR